MQQQPLKLPGRVHIAKDADQLYDDLAGLLIRCAFNAIENRGVFHIALSGGSTPEPFYIRLVIDPRFRAMPWKHTHIWLVDERCVPQDHDQSNIKMILHSLLDHLPVPNRQVHPMPVLTDAGPAQYENDLRNTIKQNEQANIRLDFILLGMGSDTHTASLFPNSPAVNESEKLITLNTGPNVTPPDRMTMTYPLLNAARQIAILVVGPDKHEALRKVDQQLSKQTFNKELIPISAINPNPAGGLLTWFLDADAAGDDDFDDAIELA